MKIEFKWTFIIILIFSCGRYKVKDKKLFLKASHTYSKIEFCVNQEIIYYINNKEIITKKLIKITKKGNFIKKEIFKDNISICNITLYNGNITFYYNGKVHKLKDESVGDYLSELDYNSVKKYALINNLERESKDKNIITFYNDNSEIVYDLIKEEIIKVSTSFIIDNQIREVSTTITYLNKGGVKIPDKRETSLIHGGILKFKIVEHLDRNSLKVENIK